MQVEVDHIEPLRPEARASAAGAGAAPIKKKGFEKLILDEETKTLLKSLITNHMAEKRPAAPAAAGEGNGLVILLHGYVFFFFAPCPPRVCPLLSPRLPWLAL